MSLTHRSKTGHPTAGPASAAAPASPGVAGGPTSSGVAGGSGKRHSGRRRDEAVTISDADLIRLAPRPLAFMFRYVMHHKVQHLLILASVVLAVAAVVGSSYAVHYLVDTLTGYHDGSMRKVWGAVALLGALIAVDNLAWRVGGWVAARAFVEVTGDLRRDLFRHLTGHAPSYFADRMPGTLAGRITATSNAMFTLENLATWNVLPPILNVALSILLLLTVSPLMAVVLIGLAAAISLLMFRLAAGGRPLHHRYASDAARVDGELLDIINNMPLVRAFGATRRERVRFSQRMEGEMSARSRSLRYLEKLRLIHAVLTAILTAGLLIWAVMLWHNHVASIGDVVMVVTLGFMILHGTRDLAVALVETIQHVARLAEALSTLLLPHDMPDAANAGGFPGHARGEIVFEHVTYSYPGGSPVLDDFNLRVDAGTRIGMVGRSGSGKTTVLALLQRMRYIQGGRIMIDGKDLLSLTEEALRAVISVVPQDVSLFHRSVLENIRYGKPEATDEEVHAAAEASGCREFIEAMPEGFRTEVGDRGVKLSGGQRQRLAIARAFLRNAPILLLDEATSALDSESEQKVQEALDRLMVGRTVVAVAHRLSTLRDFDRIVVMQSGRVLQDGAPSVLERSEGAYRDLLSRQAMSLEDID